MHRLEILAQRWPQAGHLGTRQGPGNTAGELGQDASRRKIVCNGAPQRADQDFGARVEGGCCLLPQSGSEPSGRL